MREKEVTAAPSHQLCKALLEALGEHVQRRQVGWRRVQLQQHVQRRLAHRRILHAGSVFIMSALVMSHNSQSFGVTQRDELGTFCQRRAPTRPGTLHCRTGLFQHA